MGSKHEQMLCQTKGNPAVFQRRIRPKQNLRKGEHEHSLTTPRKAFKKKWKRAKHQNISYSSCWLVFQKGFLLLRGKKCSLKVPLALKKIQDMTPLRKCPHLPQPFLYPYKSLSLDGRDNPIPWSTEGRQDSADTSFLCAVPCTCVTMRLQRHEEQYE